jgi:hypothetical protein
VCGGDEYVVDFSEWSIWHHCEPACIGCAKWAERIDARLNMLVVKRTVSTTITWEKVS